MNHPPLSIAAVQQLYPRLFRQYTFLSDREKQAHEDSDFGDGAKLALDPKTGLCTTIMFTDFNEPLQHQEGCPMKTESDANKFAMFLWNFLKATESGSVGGDACRQFDALNSALGDILPMTSTVAKFEHLLGWTVAAVNHQLHALLSRGEPDRNRSLFKAVGDEWKKVFDANLEAMGVSEELRSFANWNCEYFQKLLKAARKEYGDYARYTFNFIRKPRPAKAPPVATSASVSAAAVAPSVAATSASSLATMSAAKKNADVVTLDKPPQEVSSIPQPWEQEGFIPRSKSGKQKSPNVIRTELQKYIDQCKAEGTMTQTQIIQEMGVNNNTFRRFMNPKTYKDQWSALQNGTYWAAGRLLAQAKHDADCAKKATAKRKAAGGESTAKKVKVGNSTAAAGSAFPPKNGKPEALALIQRISAVEGVADDSEIYDSCPQLVKKIKDFLQRDGVTKASLQMALGNIQSKQLNAFLAGKGQDQCGTVVYPKAWVFFEKLRILEGKNKSAARLKNEETYSPSDYLPGGFSTRKNRGGYIKYLACF